MCSLLFTLEGPKIGSQTAVRVDNDSFWALYSRIYIVSYDFFYFFILPFSAAKPFRTETQVKAVPLVAARRDAPFFGGGPPRPNRSLNAC